MNKNDIIEFFDCMWYKIKNWMKNWIYPAYNLKNLFFNRYDLVKLPLIKPYEYSDVSLRMEYAVFELIKFFIEKENPEERVEWYGEYGHIYGGTEKYPEPITYPELKGKYVMDLIKEIYEFYTITRVELQRDYNYLLMIQANYLWGFKIVELENQEDVPEDKKLYEMTNYKKNYTLESPEIQQLNWDILLKYFKNKNDIFKEHAVYEQADKIEVQLISKTRYYLHLALDIHEYLWT